MAEDAEELGQIQEQREGDHLLLFIVILFQKSHNKIPAEQYVDMKG